MKRRVLAIGMGLFLLVLMPASAFAANPANIDQSNPEGAAQANDGGHTFAQTFTTGKTGSFSSVDLWLSGTGAVTVNIEAVDGSHLPTGSSLATGTGTIGGSAGWVNFPFTVPLSVVPGQMYAIVFVLSDSQFAYGSDNGSDTYVNGVAYWFNTQNSTWTALGNTETLPSDEAFRTYVDPVATPAPPTAASAPPTSTLLETSTSSGDGIAWLLPLALIVSFSGFAVFVSRRRRLFQR
jgi:hypothetical protein